MESVRYIAIEGVIGVGKTALAHRLQADRGGARFLEIVEENPFLVGGFYQDMDRFAFDTELFFLLARFRQQREIGRALATTAQPIVADYLFEKNRIFAELTLGAEDLAIWRRLFEALAPEVDEPDLVVYLRSDPDAALDRIRTRNRPFERDIGRDYLGRLVERYERFFERYPGRWMAIDVARLDFVGREADWTAVRALVEHRIATIEAGQGELPLATPAGGAEPP